MSKQRIIKDEVWDDEWFYDLDPVEKLMWLFLLTNSRCNIAGVYKLNQKWASRMVGLDVDLFPKILGRFVDEGKIFLYEEWIVIINFTKHQAENPSVKQGISRVLEEVPQDILDRLSQAVPGCPTLLYLTLPNLTLPNGEVDADDSTDKKEKYGESGSVRMTALEYQTLVELIGEPMTKSLIEELDDYMGASGKKYKSHYKALRNWARRKIQDHAKTVKNHNTVKRVIL